MKTINGKLAAVIALLLTDQAAAVEVKAQATAKVQSKVESKTKATTKTKESSDYFFEPFQQILAQQQAIPAPEIIFEQP